MKRKINKSQRNLLKNIIILTVVVGVICFMIGFKSLTQAAENEVGLSLLANKYQSSLRRVERLILTFPTDIFQHQFFNELEHYFKLPLRPEPVGKENPFKLPPPPEDLLLEGGL